MTSDIPKGYRFKDIARTETAVRIKYWLDYHMRENVDEGNSQEKVAAHLYSAFIAAYDYGHRDHTQMFKTDDRGRFYRTQDLTGTDGEKYLRGVFNSFARVYYEPDGTMSPRLQREFDEAVQSLYGTLVANSPLAHTEFVLGGLLVEIGRGKKAQEKGLFANGIDFSRAHALSRKDEDFVGVRAREAINKAKDAEIPTQPWENPGHACVEIGGLCFLSYGADNKYLVTQSGELVDRELEERRIRQQMRQEGWNPDLMEAATNGQAPKRLAQYIQREIAPLEATEEGKKLERYKNLVKLKDRLDQIYKAETIDGVQKAECGNRLVCLDVDLLTGLRTDGKDSELARFRRFIEGKVVGGRRINEIADLLPRSYGVNTLVDTDAQAQGAFFARMQEHIRGVLAELKHMAPDKDTAALVDKAEPHLLLQLPRIYAISDEALVRPNSKEELRRKDAPNRDVRKPRIYFVQGGFASAKTRLHAFAKDELGEDARNVVTASLDNARPSCDQYWLYLGAGHNDDDYGRVDQFGKALRTVIQKRARAGGYDFILDGTGIPFEKRYERFAQSFKDAGYETTVLTAARPLYVHGDKREMEAAGEGYGDAVMQERIRRHKELRAAIPSLMVATHVKMPVAANDAKRSPYVDRQITFDTYSGPLVRGKEKIIAYTADITPHKKHDTLATLLGTAPENLVSVLKAEKLWPEEWEKAGRLPEIQQPGRLTNFKVIREDPDGRHRIEVIADMKKYKGPAMLEKGLLDGNAKGPDALYRHALSFDIMGRFQQRYRAGEAQHLLKIDYDDPLQTRRRRIPGPTNGNGEHARG